MRPAIQVKDTSELSLREYESNLKTPGVQIKPQVSGTVSLSYVLTFRGLSPSQVSGLWDTSRCLRLWDTSQAYKLVESQSV